MLQFVLQLSKGILRDQHARRQMMFYSLVVAMLMLFAGGTFLQGWLREHVLLLLIYWAVCGWITILAALLAIFDLLLLRLAARSARRELESRFLHQARREDGDPEQQREAGQ